MPTIKDIRYAIQIQQSTEKQLEKVDRVKASSPKIFLLFGVGLSYIITLLMGVIHNTLTISLTQFNIIILMGGAITSIFAGLYYSHSTRGQRSLTNSISIQKALQRVLKILSPTQTKQLLSAIGQNFGKSVSTISSAASNILQTLSKDIRKRYLSRSKAETSLND